MNFISVTLVRMIETKEPVALFDRVDDIVELGKLIDEVTDPSLCEYLDCELALKLKLHYSNPEDEFEGLDDEQKFDVYCEFKSGFEMIDGIQKAFEQEDEWQPMIPKFDYLSNNLELEHRFLPDSEDAF